MGDTFLPRAGALLAESEFNAGSGACGPAALAVLLRWHTSARVPDAKTVLDMMLARGLCAPNGVTQLSKLATQARLSGLTVTGIEWTSANVLSFAQASIRAGNGVLLEVGNGQALHDYLSGSGMDAVGLHYHLITLIGYHDGGYSSFLGCQLPPGFFACDPDAIKQNPLVGGVGRVHRFINSDWCFYPTSVLTAASPYAAFAAR